MADDLDPAAVERVAAWLAEHNAQAALLALREAAEATPGSASADPIDPYDRAAEWLIECADLIERQEGE